MYNSSIFNQDTFYKAFINDLEKAKQIVIIESPFITKKRMTTILPIFKKLREKNIHIVINTKPFEEHELIYQEQAIWAIGTMQELGIEILMTVGHHRKIAIIDDVLWEGSLNILSQNDSCELMRRIRSNECAKEMLRFTGLDNFCKW